MSRAAIPHDLKAFAGLPVRAVRCGAGLDIAVHVRGQLGGVGLPVVCVPGYVRNMADFTEFAAAMHKTLGESHPLVLVDLPGRGRSGWRKDRRAYTIGNDAHSLSVVLAALGIARAIFCGLDHGGQVIMALGTLRPAAIAGAVLVDAGPLPDPMGLVRLFANFSHIATLSSEAQAMAALKQILLSTYPAVDITALDKLAARSHDIAGRKTPLPLFDPALAARLKDFSPGDEFEPQWHLFDTLKHADLMLVRTELTEWLRAETFAEMAQRRPDATLLTIPAQGSPALLDGKAETSAIAEFVRNVEARQV